MDMTGFGTTDYSKGKTPLGYKCRECGAINCKLWRHSNKFLEDQDLVCAKCAAKEQREDISTMDKEGSCETEYGIRTSQIGRRIPAIPTVNGMTFWGNPFMPLDAYDWWTNLPTLPE